MNLDLLRQRRNLIAVSSILLVFDFAQVTITKVSLLGTDLLVGNARVIMVLAWVLWAYFLLRYYQYWRADEGQPIRVAYLKRLDNYLRAYTGAGAIQDSFGQVYDDYRVGRAGILSWRYTLQGYNPDSMTVEDGSSKDIALWRIAGWSAKSAAYVCLHTHHATDHALPFVMVLAAPLVTLFTRLHWVTQ